MPVWVRVPDRFLSRLLVVARDIGCHLGGCRDLQSLRRLVAWGYGRAPKPRATAEGVLGLTLTPAERMGERTRWVWPPSP